LLFNGLMRRALLSACAAFLFCAPAAGAAELSGRLVFCTGDDFCRYFPQPRLDVTFVAAPGETNELRMVPHPEGVRIMDAGAVITTGPFCTTISPHEASCGPPAPEGLLTTAFTGDGPDSAFADIGTVFLGAGRDHGYTEGATLNGGPGDDRLSSATSANSLVGGSGRDHLSGTGGEESFAGGPGGDLIVARGGDDRIEAGGGPDVVAGGAGRDQIYAGSGDDLVHAAEPGRDTVRCGRGDDRAALSAHDRALGCERVVRRMHH
jgi:RTX calcium-binding nonapeptide repeat (4 copies)